MGQQQLLLLVLGIVIVGLAVVVGIQAFSENQKKANADALVNDAIRIASDAQAWRLKPAAFGGGAGEAAATPWAGLSSTGFDQLGYTTGNNSYTAHTATATEFENLNGVFTIGVSTTTLTLTAVSYNPGVDVVMNTVVVTITGTTPADIATVVN